MGEDGSKKNGANDGGKCKYCGSRNLVNDTDRGEVLCDSCGLIDHMDNLDSEGHVEVGKTAAKVFTLFFEYLPPIVF